MSIVFQILTPTPPFSPGECVPPPQQRRGVHSTHYTLAGRRGGWRVNILEDERHRIALLIIISLRVGVWPLGGSQKALWLGNQQNVSHQTHLQHYVRQIAHGNVEHYWEVLFAFLLQPKNHRLNMELDLQSLFGLLCTAVLYSLAETRQLPPLWAHTRGRALLSSQDRRHLLVTPCPKRTKLYHLTTQHCPFQTVYVRAADRISRHCPFKSLQELVTDRGRREQFTPRRPTWTSAAEHSREGL